MTPIPQTIFGTHDFGWLTGGSPISVWLSGRRHRHDPWHRPTRRSIRQGREHLWSPEDVEALLAELWPDVEWPDVELGLADCVDESAERADLYVPLRRALDTLTPRERLTLIMRYGLLSRPFTLEETAACLRNLAGRGTISRGRAMQIQSKAIRRLQHPVRANPLARAIGRME